MSECNQTYDVFISHSSQNKAWAQTLAANLTGLARLNAYFRAYDSLPRRLFWDNLLTHRQEHFHWRCDILRQCGREAMQS